MKVDLKPWLKLRFNGRLEEHGSEWAIPCPDCDDGRADVNPGAAETCDGMDRTCAGNPKFRFDSVANLRGFESSELRRRAPSWK